MNSIPDLFSLLSSYEADDPAQAEARDRMLELFGNTERCFDRDCFPAHFTGSGFVYNPGVTSALFVHHAKLDRWLQPGGHADGVDDLLSVARREVWEETGMHTKLVGDGIFDLDIHQIPARCGAPEHLHYDVRFLLIPDGGDLRCSAESHEVRWIPLAELPLHTTEESVLRMAQKAQKFELQFRSPGR